MGANPSGESAFGSKCHDVGPAVKVEYLVGTVVIIMILFLVKYDGILF